MSFSHSGNKRHDISLDIAVACVPILIWSVYMFGARVITLSLVAVFVAVALEYALHFALKRRFSPDPSVGIHALLTVFSMPVTVPLYVPAVSAVICVLAGRLRIKKRRLFNSYFLAVTELHILFREAMTTFTKPLSYFSAFDITIDPELISGYRVISPLQYMADGSVYEDGVYAQFYGYASGALGEIAICAMIVGAVWLFAKKTFDFSGTVAFLAPILLLGLVFPSADAESEFFAFATLFTGAIFLTAVFAMNDRESMPMTRSGRIIVGVIAGASVFFLRKYTGGIEMCYPVILVLNLLTPFIEKITAPIPKGKKK